MSRRTAARPTIWFTMKATSDLFHKLLLTLSANFVSAAKMIGGRLKKLTSPSAAET